jgi:hypothetical protein
MANSQRRYKYLDIGRDRSYLVKRKKNSDSTKNVSETDIILMLEFLIDNILVMFGGRAFQQTVSIHMPMGKQWAPLPVDLFLYSYEEDFIQGLSKKNEKSYPDPLISRSALYMMSFH